MNWLYQLGNNDNPMPFESVKSFLSILKREEYGKTEIRGVKFLYDFLGSLDSSRALQNKIIDDTGFFETQVGEKILSMIIDFYDQNGSLSNLRVHRSQNFTIFNRDINRLLIDLLEPRYIDQRDLIAIIENLHLILIEASG